MPTGLQPTHRSTDDALEHYSRVSFEANAATFGLTDKRTITAHAAWIDAQMPA